MARKTFIISKIYCFTVENRNLETLCSSGPRIFYPNCIHIFRPSLNFAKSIRRSTRVHYNRIEFKHSTIFFFCFITEISSFNFFKLEKWTFNITMSNNYSILFTIGDWTFDLFYFIYFLITIFPLSYCPTVMFIGYNKIPLVCEMT